MRRLGNGWIEFEVWAESEDRILMRCPATEVVKIETYIGSQNQTPGAQVSLCSDPRSFTVETDDEVARLLELVTDPDFRSMSDDDLQHELELAERRHTRVLAEVARRSP